MTDVFDTAIYIRLSKEDGDKEESDSINNQRKLLIKYVQDRENFLLYDIYIDDGYSGTNFERPGFKRLIQDVEEKRINCIIVKDLSRFGRDYIDTGRYLERYFPERGVRFISISDGIDSMKKAYDLMLPIKNILNEQYSRDISQKIQATIKIKQESGEFIGSFASYGYKKSEDNKNQLIIDEYPASVVRRIFDMYVSGVGKQKIARILTQEGIVCPSEYKRQQGQNYHNHNYRYSSYWTYSTINSILKKEIYIGNMVQHTKHQQIKGKQNIVDKREWIVVKNTHEPIIDIDTWNKAQHLLKCRTRELDLTTNQNIFAGFLQCGDCGAAMNKISWKKADGSKSVSFYCGAYKRLGRSFCTPHTLPSKILEQIVLSDLKKIIENVADLQTLVNDNQYKKQNNYQRVMKQHLLKQQQELKKIRKWKQGIYEDYKESLITKEEYISYKTEYCEKEKDLLQQIEELQNVDIESRKTTGNNSGWIDRLLKYKDIQTLDRNIVVEMIYKIVVYDNRRIRIYYNFSDELKDIFDNEIIIRN